MNIGLLRYSTKEYDTLGLLFVDGHFECFTIEDGRNEVKEWGETRIPEGTYEIKMREVLSPKTTQYRKKYDWFTWHLELQDVPNYTNIYIHIGNTHEDTNGCILTGCGVMDKHEVRSVVDSTTAFKALYLEAQYRIKQGEKVQIQIIDIENDLG